MNKISKSKQELENDREHLNNKLKELMSEKRALQNEN